MWTEIGVDRMKTRVVVFRRKDKVVINRVREGRVSKRDLLVRPTSVTKDMYAWDWIVSELLEITCYIRKDKSAILGYMLQSNYNRLKGV